MKALKLSAWIILSLSILIFAACSGDGGGSSSGGATGILSVNLADNTIQGCEAVFVTIDEVRVHTHGGWQQLTPTSPNHTHNLLELQNGVREKLGIAELAEGPYTQMRLIIGDTPDDGHFSANYIIDEDDEYHELKIPSGYNTGIKIVHGFDIEEDQTTELILDFCVSDSIVMPGHDGEWLLKPTIKVLDTDNYSIVSGTVTDNYDNSAIWGSLVSAQIYESEPQPGGKVVVQASTTAEENGDYALFLKPGIYNIVAYEDGYNPTWVCSFNAASTGTYELDLHLDSLPAESLGSVSGTVVINNSIPEDHATLSFRQTADCGDGNDDIEIEVKSLNVANEGNYGIDKEFNLPVGGYTVVATSVGGITETYPIAITVTESGVTQNILLPDPHNSFE